MNWKTGPIELNEIPEDVDYVIVIDENGSFGNFEKLVKEYRYSAENPFDEDDMYFTLTGIMLDINVLSNFQNDINEIKDKYWDKGYWFNKKRNRIEKVHFHTADAFSKFPNQPFNIGKENHANMQTDIITLIDKTDFTIISSCINIKKHIEKYTYPFHPYKISVEFLLERFAMKLNRENKRAVIVFESRGSVGTKKLDNNVHRKCLDFMSSGSTIYGQVDTFIFRNIDGVYFNPKLCSNNPLKSYEFIELVDMVSYPIYKEFKSDFTKNRKDYLVICPKFDSRDTVVEGCGLKIFP